MSSSRIFHPRCRWGYHSERNDHSASWLKICENIFDFTYRFHPNRDQSHSKGFYPAIQCPCDGFHMVGIALDAFLISYPHVPVQSVVIAIVKHNSRNRSCTSEIGYKIHIENMLGYHLGYMLCHSVTPHGYPRSHYNFKKDPGNERIRMGLKFSENLSA